MLATAVGLVVVGLILFSAREPTRLYAYVASRWMRLKSEFEDKALALEFARRVENFDGASPYLLLGSSTVARMPASPCGLPFANLGVESLCTHHMVASIDKLARFVFDAVFLYAGVNDMIVGTSAAVVADNLERVVVSLRAERCLVMPIVESPYQTALGATRLKYLREINEATRQRLEGRVEWVIAPEFETADFSADLLHLNERGYERLMERLCAVLRTRPART